MQLLGTRRRACSACGITQTEPYTGGHTWVTTGSVCLGGLCDAGPGPKWCTSCGEWSNYHYSITFSGSCHPSKHGKYAGTEIPLETKTGGVGSFYCPGCFQTSDNVMKGWIRWKSSGDVTLWEEYEIGYCNFCKGYIYKAKCNLDLHLGYIDIAK